MEKTPLVHAIVLNWNSYEDSTACVRSLEEIDYPHLKILIVDNASRDGSETILKKRFPVYPFLQTGRNRGYGDGNNLGIRHALSQGAEYVWILNPDVVVEKNSLPIMMEAMEADPSIGIASPRVILKSPTKAFEIDGMSLAPEKGFWAEYNVATDGEEPLPETRETDSVLGCSMLIRSEVLEEIGLIRDDFFMYQEEIEFCLRAKKHGWKRVICPRVENWHFFRGPTRRHAFYLARNALFLARLQSEKGGTQRFFGRPLFQTVRYILRRERPFHYRRGFRAGRFLIVLSGVLAGLTKPLKPVPRV